MTTNWQIALLSLFVLTPHPYNPVSSLLFPHTETPHTVPESYYDDHGIYGTIESNTSQIPNQPHERPRANATLLMLARNSDVDDVVRAVRELEDRFNHNHRYPWVFLNEESFSDDFKRYVAPDTRAFFVPDCRIHAHAYTHSRVSIVISGPVYFGQIPEEHWYQPSWINETKAEEERKKMEEENVIYGGSISCGFPPFLLRTCCDNRCCSQISQYVPVQLWGPILPSSHPAVNLTNPHSSSIGTHYCKISAIIGVSSACSPF